MKRNKKVNNAKNQLASTYHRTIAKIIWTSFKKLIQFADTNIISMKPYFDVRPLSLNHRALLDYELVAWYFERADQYKPGVFKAFRSLLDRER